MARFIFVVILPELETTVQVENLLHIFLDLKKVSRGVGVLENSR